MVREPVIRKIGWNALRTLLASEELLSMLAARKLLTNSELLKLRCYRAVKHPVALLSSISIFMCKNWFCMTEVNVHRLLQLQPEALFYLLRDVLKGGQHNTCWPQKYLSITDKVATHQLYLRSEWLGVLEEMYPFCSVCRPNLKYHHYVILDKTVGRKNM